MTRKNNHRNGKRHAPETRHAEEPRHKKPRTSDAPTAQPSVKAAKAKVAKRVSFFADEPTASTSKLPEPKKAAKKTALQKLVEKTSSTTSVNVPRKGRSQVEKEEDAYIEYLERQLGYSKSGKRTGRYGNGMDEDGLDGMFTCVRTSRLAADIFLADRYLGGH